MINVALFDVGGVLLPFPTAEMEADIQATLGIPQSLLRNAWDTYAPELYLGVIDEQTFWARFLQKVQRDAALLPSESLLSRMLATTYRPDANVLALATQLRAQGIRTAILSHACAPHADALQLRGLYDGFDPVILSHEVGMTKPDRAIYHLALQKLGVEPQEVVFIDDLAVNVQAAQAMGMAGIVFQHAAQLRNELYLFGLEV